MLSLGIDTSNYTTSVALFDSVSMTCVQKKKLLPVKPGERGIRQSDAVFHHNAQISQLLKELFEECGNEFDVIGVSNRPRNVDGSYMPCFTVGVSQATTISSACGVPLYGFSHQCGHIAAALYSAGMTDLFGKEFIAFHVSGGTTECLHVTPDSEFVFNANIIGGTSDLNAGQAVDRCGVMLGLNFPCGPAIEKLALKSNKVFNPKEKISDGFCSISGLENKLNAMHDSGEPDCDVARFCLDSIYSYIDAITSYAVERVGNVPLVYAGGVMSNTVIRDRLLAKYDGWFAQPQYSCDNAAGVALLAALRRSENA